MWSARMAALMDIPFQGVFRIRCESEGYEEVFPGRSARRRSRGGRKRADRRSGGERARRGRLARRQRTDGRRADGNGDDQDHARARRARAIHRESQARRYRSRQLHRFGRGSAGRRFAARARGAHLPAGPDAGRREQSLRPNADQHDDQRQRHDDRLDEGRQSGRAHAHGHLRRRAKKIVVRPTRRS